MLCQYPVRRQTIAACVAKDHWAVSSVRAWRQPDHVEP